MILYSYSQKDIFSIIIWNTRIKWDEINWNQISKSTKETLLIDNKKCVNNDIKSSEMLIAKNNLYTDI